MPLSEHVYTVAIAWICIRFCIKPEHSSMETIQIIQKAAAMGNWWLAASRWQRACSCITSCAEIFGKPSNHPGDSDPLKPRLVSCDFWIFLKLKSPLKGRRFLTVNEIQENMMRQLMVIGRTVWGPKVPSLKGTEVPLCYVVFLESSLINVSIFHIAWLDTFWTDLVYIVRQLYMYVCIYIIYM